ncbi:hypothetical protein N9K03_00700 [bacterium]|jgi:hypothetical protein|nr:hypothetical protein [bacterium]
MDKIEKWFKEKLNIDLWKQNKGSGEGFNSWGEESFNSWGEAIIIISLVVIYMIFQDFFDSIFNSIKTFILGYF